MRTFRAQQRKDGPGPYSFERASAIPYDTVPLSGFGNKPIDNDIRVENTKAGIGVRETGDQPIYKMYFWSTRTTVCPEVYIKVHVEPGRTFKWRTAYEFYTLKG